MHNEQYMNGFYSLVETFKEIKVGDLLSNEIFNRISMLEKEFVYPILKDKEESLE